VGKMKSDAVCLAHSLLYACGRLDARGLWDTHGLHLTEFIN
jgi:hypothetical protein